MCFGGVGIFFGVFFSDYIFLVLRVVGIGLRFFWNILRISYCFFILFLNLF